MCDTFTLGGPHQKLRPKSNNFLDEKKNQFYRTKIEQKFRKNGRNFRENEVENFVESISKFFHFHEFHSTKISLETLSV